MKIFRKINFVPLLIIVLLLFFSPIIAEDTILGYEKEFECSEIHPCGLIMAVSPYEWLLRSLQNLL